MGVKTGAVSFRLSKNQTDALSVSTFMNNLLKYHGTAAGVAAADEVRQRLNPLLSFYYMIINFSLL